ncbi:MAG: hypothetical protein C0423_09300 [Methylibium sp.]|nr:hypothetical protein [Methylibium sp.]
MSILASIALAASTATLPQCSWDRPGVNPFMGDVVAAVDRYQDIPAPVRAKLKARMQARQYDEIALITRDGIEGKAQYGAEIRDMHFGAGSVCRTVTRAKWTAKMQERGLVYCEDGHCILVPTVCRNVSRIQRIAAKPVATVAAAQPAVVDPQTELEMEPPGAGVPGGSTPSPAGPSFAQLASPLPTTTVAAAPPGPGLIPGAVPLVPTLPPGIPTVTPAVPEPETWALLLSGLAVVAWVAKRRRPT